jgi:hypothetical protein
MHYTPAQAQSIARVTLGFQVIFKFQPQALLEIKLPGFRGAAGGIQLIQNTTALAGRWNSVTDAVVLTTSDDVPLGYHVISFQLTLPVQGPYCIPLLVRL